MEANEEEHENLNSSFLYKITSTMFISAEAC